MTLMPPFIYPEGVKYFVMNPHTFKSMQVRQVGKKIKKYFNILTFFATHSLFLRSNYPNYNSIDINGFKRCSSSSDNMNGYHINQLCNCTSVSDALVCLMVTLLLLVMVAQMEMASPGT